MIFIFVLLHGIQVSAHSPIQDLLCTHEQKTIEIRIQKDKALIKRSEEKQSSLWNVPKSEDKWDETNKQIFDTYDFVKKGKKITLKVPETKGPITRPFALYEEQNYDCKSLSKN